MIICMMALVPGALILGSAAPGAQAKESKMNKTIDVICVGEVWGGGIGFEAQNPKGRGHKKILYHQDYSGNWYSTNNRDWEPEAPVLPTVTFNIVTKFKKKK